MLPALMTPFSIFRPVRLAGTLLSVVGLLGACQSGPKSPDSKATPGLSAAEASESDLRKAFNRKAAEMNLPLFWVADRDHDGKPSEPELARLFGMDASEAIAAESPASIDRSAASVIQALAAPAPKDPRQLALQKELDQGQPTLIQNSLKADSPAEQKMAQELLAAGLIIDRLYQRQLGSYPLKAKLEPGDMRSAALYYRNQSPWCVAPKTEGDPNCSALPKRPAQISGLYPAKIQTPGFCDRLAAHPDAKSLLSQFTVVAYEGDKLTAIPYTTVYQADMQAIKTHLEAAAAAIQDLPSEAAFHRYLLAAAQAFQDNNWPLADEAWSKMNVNNSKWYLRIGPDEVYFEPCSRKAGFHMGFARINEESKSWQAMLDPMKQSMEADLAQLAGAPYVERKVSFHLPDFINIVLNAGDARNAHGATIGQSLPNWGPVANEGRGRTVAMTNLYTDPDSRLELRKQAESVLCESAMKDYVDDPAPQVLSTVLHEAAHNLGPAHEYRANGKTDDEAFGGPLASTFEELKAQTAALYFTDVLAEKKKLTDTARDQAHLRDLVWAFGHISRGMFTAEGKDRPYSQLAAIQLAHLMKEGVVHYLADQKAANQTDLGCFEVKMSKFPAAAKTLMTQVLRIKATGDRAGAEALKATILTEEAKALHQTVQTRWLRAPKASFVYAIDR